MPLSLFITSLVLIFLLGGAVLLKSVFSDEPLNKGDVYLRATVFLCALFFSLAASTGVYIGQPTVDSINSTAEIVAYSFIPAFEEYWVIIPFSIAVVSLFSTIYAWLSVFVRKQEN